MKVGGGGGASSWPPLKPGGGGAGQRWEGPVTPEPEAAAWEGGSPQVHAWRFSLFSVAMFQDRLKNEKCWRHRKDRSAWERAWDWCIWKVPPVLSPINSTFTKRLLIAVGFKAQHWSYSSKAQSLPAVLEPCNYKHNKDDGGYRGSTVGRG